jgi:hypothetical protein
MKCKSLEFAKVYLDAYNATGVASPIGYENYEPDEFMQAHCETIAGDFEYPRKANLGYADCQLAKPLFHYWRSRI